jgi:cell division protease FtsH
VNSRSLITGISLLVLFFSLINNFEWNSNPISEIGYSDFLMLVDRGQVTDVIVQGDSINGSTSSGKSFHTLGMYDPKLIQRLRDHQVNINIEQSGNTPWYISLLLQWGPLLLLVGVWIFLMRKMPGSGKIMSIGRSKAKKYEEEIKDYNFSNVAGVEEAKEDLVEVVDFLKEPVRFQELGGKIPKGVLMVGPPGTGKTLLAKAVAGEAGAAFYSISGSDFVEMFVGVGASRVRDLFTEARANAPCIIFIDEIDAVGRHRGAGLGSGHDEREQTLNALLVEMDGFDGTEGIITLAATNRADILDPALLRPGRFDRQVYVGLPDVRGREAILEVHGKKIVLDKGVNLSIIARGTPGFSGADLANLTNEGALYAARQSKSSVTLSDLEWARDKIMMGAERKSMILTEDEKKYTSYHEAGHAIVAAFNKKADPVHKITIIPRGQALGITSFLPEVDRLSMDKATLNAKLQVSFGGKAAEELIFDDSSTGVGGDLKSATDIAYNMVCQWGMSQKLGVLTISQGDSGNYLAMDYTQEENVSDEMQQIVDDEVKNLLTKAYRSAMKILKEHEKLLHSLAKMLMEIETVTAEQFQQLVKSSQAKPKPEPA